MNGFKTYAGIATFAVGAILTHFKINLTTDEIQPIVNQALELGGALFALYGRFKAQPKAK